MHRTVFKKSYRWFEQAKTFLEINWGSFRNFPEFDKHLFFSTDIHLLSWHLSVYNITSSSARLQWAEFPLNVSITHFMVMFTEENTNISFLFKVNSLHDRNYHVQKLIKPYRMYKFQVLAFTGSIDNMTYSTETELILTGEGGRTSHLQRKR